ncbi:sigma-54 dependent transcriptional regulator [Segetibacter sp.]|uniref:sigma-54-dependent transcriptional regulator n=1 Tax=Segetibacter sp. TaxID=2231182 RepID=UPI002618C735|nr:sigma-54 dependent transcriptional regulator [Segetibacter sp.]MCW3082521.1 sigma-54 factor interaction protein [Segetibacter sp.]
MSNILLVEDDRTFSKILEAFLSKSGFNVEAKYDVKTGLGAMSENNFDVLLLDYRLPDGTGLDFLTSCEKKCLNVPTIIMTSFNDVRTAVKAMRSGAFEYIIKPLNPEELLMVINEALNKDKQKASGLPSPSAFIEGQSKVAQKLADHINLVAPTDMSVLIIGESGTGKEYVAKSIHELSKRKNQPFVAIDSGTLSNDLAASELFGHVKGAFTGALSDKKGVFEMANGGTVFLDEIGNLGYDVQVKLLRMLQERTIQPVGSNKLIEVDIRLVCATNENLVASISKGDFREDIYHRINEFKIQVPSLREREEDLELFVTHFIQLANKELGKAVKSVTDEVMDIFKNYDWPGNLRELKNVIKRMVLLSKMTIAGEDTLPDEMIDSINEQPKKQIMDLKAIQEAGEKETISKVLQQTKYNKTKAARLLNIDRKTLYYKMELYGIE